jgi:sugar phosphate isomerase/epimerase
MANYEGIGRSNYVRVTDEAAFRAAAERLNCEVLTDREGRFGIADDNDDGSGFLFLNFSDDEEQPEVYDPVEELAPLLAEGEVMVLMEAGHEKHRYASGWARAFDRSGESVAVNLYDIYKLAEQKFPGAAAITEATY